MSADSVRQRLIDGLSGPMEEACLSLFETLLSRPQNQVERLTYSTLGKWIGRSADDAILQAVVNVLSQMRGHPLERYFLFLDEREGREVEVPLEDIKNALAQNLFINPETGEEIAEFRSLIIPAFRVTKEFKGYLHESG